MGTQNLPAPQFARPKLLEQVRDAIRRLHYSYRTEETYIHWIKRHIYFHGKRHPEQILFSIVNGMYRRSSAAK